jgi:hypothetical protein
METFQASLDGSIPIPQHQGAVNELQKYRLEMHTTTKLPRGNIFPIRIYADPKTGYEHYFDLGRYSYDDTLKKIWRNKWSKTTKPKLLKGTTIATQNCRSIKLDLKLLMKQFGIWNRWI